MIHALPFSLLLSAVVTAAAQTAQPVPRAFSYTFKPGQGIGNVTPITICNHTARQPGMHAATLFWATGSLEWPEFGDTVIKYYVDGETTASVTATINQLTGMFYNHSDPHVAPLSKILPFGNARIGRTGIGGGAYNSIVVPFRTRLLVTAVAAPYSKSTKSVLYSKIAGLENYQHGSVLGRHGMFMSDRVRLRSYASDVVLAPAQRHTICNFNRSSNPSPNSWGSLLYVWQRIESESAFCLEGRHFAQADSEAGVGAGDSLQLSSGFEDYYLSGQYFDAGEFATELSGMTSSSSYIYPHAVTAYRFHDVDPVPFEKSLRMTWENGMHKNGSLAASSTRARSLCLAYV